MSFLGGLFGNPANAQPAAPTDPVSDAIMNPYKSLPISAKLQLLGASLQDLNHPGALDQAQQAVLSQRQNAVKMAMLRSYMQGAPQLSSTAGPAQAAGSASAAPAVAALQGGQGGPQVAPGGTAPQMMPATPQVSSPAMAGGGLPNPYGMSLADAQRRDAMAGFLGMTPHAVDDYAKFNHYTAVNGNMVNDTDPRISVKGLPADGNGLSYVADPSQPSGYRAVAVQGYSTTPDKDTGVSFVNSANGPVAAATPGFSQAIAGVTRAKALAERGADAAIGTAPAPGYQLGPNGWVDPGGTAQAAAQAHAQAEAYGSGLGADQTTPAAGVTDANGAPIQNASRADQLGLPGPGGAAPGAGAAPPPSGGVRPMKGAHVYQPQGGGPVSTAGAPRIGQPRPLVPGLGQSPADAAAATDQAKADITKLQSYQQEADQARQKLVTLQRMQALNNTGKLGQGALNPAAIAASGALSSLPGFKSNLPAAQQYQALVGNLFSTPTDDGKSQMTNMRNYREFQFKLNSYPLLSQTQQGRSQILANEIADAQRSIKIGQGATTWAARNGRLSAMVPGKDGKSYNFEMRKAQLLNNNPLMVGQ